jgi:hypothetical protein
MKRHSVFAILVVLVVVTLLSACFGQTGSSAERDTVENQQNVYAQVQPIPWFDFSLERDILIQLYKLRNEAVATYTVVTSSFGNLLWQCPSIGYPLPADTQLTAPERLANDEYRESSVIPQPEPNGLYSSTNTVGTWVTCVSPDGKAYPVYTEMNAHAFPFVVVQNDKGEFVIAEGQTPSASLNITK